MTDRHSAIIDDIQDYIHENSYGWEEIGFDEDHIYVTFEDNEDVSERMESLFDDIEDEFNAYEISCSYEENTLNIYIDMPDQLDSDFYEYFVEQRVDYEARAKIANISETNGTVEFKWISQDSPYEEDAYAVAEATNEYLILLSKGGVQVKGTYFCRYEPENYYTLTFTVGKDPVIEDITPKGYLIVDGSEYFTEDQVDTYEEAIEAFREMVQHVHSRLQDLDEDELGWYEDGIEVRMLSGKVGTDTYEWDEVKSVIVTVDGVDNPEELE